MDIPVHPALNTFLALLLAHLTADFPLQSNWIARNKGKRSSALIVHIAIHYGTAWICLKLFTSALYFSGFNQLITIGYLVVHFLIDTAKSRITAGKPKRDTTTLFVLDQLLHIFTAALTAVLLERAHLSEFAQWHITETVKFHILAVAIVYIGAIFGGGHLIRYFTQGLASNLSGETGSETPEELKDAGMYVGWVERFLVITAIAVQAPALVGLILTGKSIARFPELKSAPFAEYFLIGTLMSISIAVIGGMILARMFYGTFSLK
jgi:hypothetical protein